MKWVKNIIVWTLAIVGLSVSGIFTIDMKVETETKQSRVIHYSALRYSYQSTIYFMHSQIL